MYVGSRDKGIEPTDTRKVNANYVFTSAKLAAMLGGGGVARKPMV